VAVDVIVGAFVIALVGARVKVGKANSMVLVGARMGSSVFWAGAAAWTSWTVIYVEQAVVPRHNSKQEICTKPSEVFRFILSFKTYHANHWLQGLKLDKEAREA